MAISIAKPYYKIKPIGDREAIVHFYDPKNGDRSFIKINVDHNGYIEGLNTAFHSKKDGCKKLMDDTMERIKNMSVDDVLNWIKSVNHTEKFNL